MLIDFALAVRDLLAFSKANSLFAGFPAPAEPTGARPYTLPLHKSFAVRLRKGQKRCKNKGEVNQLKGMGNVDLIHAAASQMKCKYLITAPLSQN